MPDVQKPTHTIYNYYYNHNKRQKYVFIMCIWTGRDMNIPNSKQTIHKKERKLLVYANKKYKNEIN